MSFKNNNSAQVSWNADCGIFHDGQQWNSKLPFSKTELKTWQEQSWCVNFLSVNILNSFTVFPSYHCHAELRYLTTEKLLVICKIALKTWFRRLNMFSRPHGTHFSQQNEKQLGKLRWVLQAKKLCFLSNEPIREDISIKIMNPKCLLPFI